MIDIERIQTQLRVSARANLEEVTIPPFTCFFHPDESGTWSNYAIPDIPITDAPHTALEKLALCFREQERIPRFEYLAGFAPELAEILEKHGYQLEMPTELL
ncbi:MAG: hypothetical protein AAF515_22570, partial [Pseudomonadota bacterium]